MRARKTVILLVVFVTCCVVPLKHGSCDPPNDCAVIKEPVQTEIEAMKLDDPDKYRDFKYALRYIRRINKRQELSISCRVAKAIVDHVHWKKYRFISEEHRFNFLSVLMGIIKVESRFDPGAISHKNARGLMQVHWPTWKRYFGSPEEAHDLHRNLSVGTGILRLYMHRSRSNLRLALYKYLGAKDDRYADMVINSAMLFKNGARAHPMIED